MRVVFLGTAAFARPALRALVEAGHDVALVITQPDRPRGRSQRPEPPPVKEEAEALGLARLLQPARLADPDAMATFAAAGPFDLGICVAFGQILRQAALDLPRLGMVNLHASLLPRWRGAAPVQRGILAGDREGGVTLQRMVKKLDAGPILAARARPFGADETAEEALVALSEVGAALLVEALPALERGDLGATAQDESLVTLAPPIDKAEGLIDWSQPAEAIARHVRAMAPWPGSFTFVRRRDAAAQSEPPRLVVTRARAASAEALAGALASAPADVDTHTAAPGVVLGLDALAGAILVRAGGASALALHEVQPAGKRRMDARAYWTGRALAVGDRLGAATEPSPETPA